MTYCDAHIHLAEFPHKDIHSFCKKNEYSCCINTHSIEEYEQTTIILHELEKNATPHTIHISFGIHPQLPDLKKIAFLEQLLQENNISAIGEIGFDFFTPEYRATEKLQSEAWESQLELAIHYQKPIIIHSRRSLDKIFSYSNELKKLPAVLFHSWPGSPTEAKSFLTRGINAYFSIGKQILNGNKRAIQSAIHIPLEHLLLETDAPYQTLKDETRTPISDIEKVYQKVFDLRCDAEHLLFAFFSQLVADNFSRSFKDSPVA